jgi:hypothetical protein
MSDVSVAPAAAPSPPANQVAVESNPVRPPQPASDQNITAPDPGKRSISDAVERAFARSRGEVDTARPRQQEQRQSSADGRERPGPARAEMGHNRPPEETRIERREKANSQRETLNLKKRPDDQTPPPATSKAREVQDKERARAEHGHFAPRQPQSPAPQLPGHAPYNQPPRGVSQAAARDWATTPQTVRGDIHRIHKAFNEVAHKFRADRAAMAPIYRYHQMAQQHGTTLDRALDNYTGMERLLRSDPLRGLDVIVNNLNLRSQDGQKLNLRDLCWYYLNQSPDQHRALQQQNLSMAQHHQLQAVQANQQALAQQLAYMQYQRDFAMKRQEVDRFAESHPRLDELGQHIHRELNLGFDIHEAYRRADLLNPATHAGGTRTTADGLRNQNRSDRSISGAPDTALNGAARRKRSATVFDAVTNAARRVGL